MQAETLAGLFGLGGALVGASVTIWATKVGQREQAKQNRETLEFQAEQTRKAQLSELDAAATDAALQELIELDEYLRSSDVEPTARRDETLDWEEVASSHLRKVQLAISRIPNRSVYNRVMISLELSRSYRSASPAPRHFHYVRLVRSMVADMTEVLLSHRRGEEESPPVPDHVADAQRRAEEAAEQWRRQVAHLLREES
ncbi:hypothetical protein ABZ370_35770 [Streptomyces sp. NPDC005962]|uniref:hypothetical protein n=1 Tax=Streptomyces sp. NPDC005962 TaxID=3154466 RepID=UPI0033DE8D70